jgi:hypothetical protein
LSSRPDSVNHSAAEFQDALYPEYVPLEGDGFNNLYDTVVKSFRFTHQVTSLPLQLQVRTEKFYTNVVVACYIRHILTAPIE